MLLDAVQPRELFPATERHPGKPPRRGQVRFAILFTIPVLAGALVVLTTLDQPPSSSSSGPALQVDAMAQDLGVTGQRQVWHVEFAVLNTGQRRLVINELDRECDCINSVSRTFLISPGETRLIPFELDARFGTGLVRQSWTFQSNDPARSRFRLAAQVRVDPRLAPGQVPTLADPVEPE